MTGSAGIPKWLPLAIAFALGACARNDPPDEPPAPVQRTLADAMGTDANGSPSLDSLRDAAQRAPNNPTAQQLYGIAAERAALYPEALAAIDRAVAVGEPTPARLLAQGRIALEGGDVPAAARAYSKVLEQDPGNVDALNGLGVADDLQHHHDQAREQYQAALKLQPGDWRVRGNLAMSLVMSGRADAAALVLSGAEKRDAAPHRARHNLALALVAAGKREQAISVLRVDMPAPEAAALADEFAAFAKWLASPEGRPPPIR